MNPYYDPTNIRAELQQAVQQLRSEMNANAQGVRRMAEERVKAADSKLADLAKILDFLRVGRSEIGDVRRIEDIPGRRVPYTVVVAIPIGNNTTSVQSQSFTVSQDGPFVAVRRMASFLSAYQAQFTNPSTGAVSTFSGRSNGRWRPIHSAYDLMDAQTTSQVTTANPIPTGGLGGVAAFVSAASGFRTMEFDGLIRVVNAGSSYPRSNAPVPTPFWTQQINSPFDLAALDFFERGETITFEVTPTHINNPAAGNASGDNLFGTALNTPAAAGWPFLDGQYDQHEGVMTPGPFTVGPLTRISTDTIARLPDGILYVGLEGYRLIQLPGTP